jgi:energy-coupling factor transporter ATP-binding protein EcfA2
VVHYLTRTGAGQVRRSATARFPERPRTIVLSTHLIDEVADLLEHVVMLDHGGWRWARLRTAPEPGTLSLQQLRVRASGSAAEEKVSA